MFKLKVKQVRIATYVLGAIASLLIGILGFRFLGEFLTTKASSSAPLNLSITQITQNSAAVKWETDQETQVVIEYGTSPTSLNFFAPEATKSKEHRLELNLLTEATTYYFQIKSGDQVFDNGGVPWTFTTLKQSEESPTPVETEATEAIEPTTATTSASPTTEPTTSPTIQPSPTVDPTTVTKDTECDLNTYKTYYYTNTPKYDQDNNGIVNLHDLSLCNAKKITPTP